MGISTKAFSAVVIAPIVMIALAGCMQQPNKQSEPLPSETSASPAVMTEEEALEIAENTYGQYLEISNQIMTDGAIHPEALGKLLSPDQYLQELETLSLIRERGQHLYGEVKFDGARLQSFEDSLITAYLCLDATQARIVDSIGDSPDLEMNRWPVLVTFSKNQANQFIISGSETWTGTNYC